MSSYRYNDIKLGIRPFRQKVGDSSTFHHLITAAEQLIPQGFLSNCFCVRTGALFKCIRLPFDVGGTRVLVLRFLSRNTARWEGGSAAINDHDERIAVELWQLLQRNIEELSRTHPASFFVSLSTNTVYTAG